MKQKKFKRFKPIKDMIRPDVIAIILLILGAVSLYQGNEAGIFFIILAVIKYFLIP